MVPDEASQEYVTITTHRGLYRYKRLSYGVSSSPAIFQRTIESLLCDIPRVGVFIHNILITGADDKEHLENLGKVVKRLAEANLRLKRVKCQFMRSEIDCLGHHISAECFSPVKAKVDAIVAVSTPTNKTELKSYMGLVNFYAKYLPNLSTVATPLYRLFRDDVPWKWGQEQAEAFQVTKEMLLSPKVLVHNDTKKPVVVSGDASPVGVGEVIAHVMLDGKERPISYVSRTLSKAEKNYSQLDKEALALIFTTKKFHVYLHGRPFTMTTDHNPLLGILGPGCGVPERASGRMQRWILDLATYEYDLKYRPAAKNANADGLSRLPQPVTIPEPPLPGDVIFLLEHISASGLTVAHMRQLTQKDPALS